MTTKRSDKEDLEAELATLERLVTIPALGEMLRRAGVTRSLPAIYTDVARGEIRMGKVGELLYATLPSEARRYITAKVASMNAAKEKHALLADRTQRLVDRLEREASL